MSSAGRSIRYAAAILLVMVASAACGGAGGSAGSSATPTPVVSPTVGPVTTPEAAVAAVVAYEPRLTGIGPKDPDLIGQSAWYEVVPASGVGAFIVAVRVGWGDCPAGCINEHTWQFAVAPDGTVTSQVETGDPVPPEAWPAPAGDGRTGLRLIATAGPVCPVETMPPDPACAPKPVPSAVVLIRDAAGDEIAQATLDAAGRMFVDLPAGDYVVEAQAVQGLMGAPAPVRATVLDGAATVVDLGYETGIR